MTIPATPALETFSANAMMVSGALPLDATGAPTSAHLGSVARMGSDDGGDDDGMGDEDGSDHGGTQQLKGVFGGAGVV